jgi:hypothetical protein
LPAGAARALGAASVVLTGDAATESASKSQDLRQFGKLNFAVDAYADPKVRRFYENLAGGEHIAEALAHSKTAVLEQFGPPASASVAAFQLVG